jgi:hypothetical protein
MRLKERRAVEADRSRAAAILAMPEAQGLDKLARTLALQTDCPVAAAQKIVAAARRGATLTTERNETRNGTLIAMMKQNSDLISLIDEDEDETAEANQKAEIEAAEAEGRRMVHERVRRVMNAAGIDGDGPRMTAAGIMACDKPDMAEANIISHVIETIPSAYEASRIAAMRGVPSAGGLSMPVSHRNGHDWRESHEAAATRQGWKKNEQH